MAVTATASNIQADYMKLLVTQLQNQNPLEPLDNNEMASQLAQFSQLQQLESMNSNFAHVLAAVEHTYANSLLNKNISFLAETGTGDVEMTEGVVVEVLNEAGEEASLVVQTPDNAKYTVGVDGVVSVRS